jgi:hypothetical protein
MRREGLSIGGYQKIRFGPCMNVDGFITMPSFRPDGRLDRLNHGGGGPKLPKTIPGEPAKVQKYPNFFRAVHLAAYQKSHGIKGLDVEVGYNIPPGMGKAKKAGGSGGSGAAGAGGQVQKGHQGDVGGGGPVNAAAMYTQDAGSPPGAVAAGTLKKKRTLLSGGGRSFGQPYGSDTILGG